MNQELIDMARQAGFFVKDNEAYSPLVLRHCGAFYLTLRA